MKPRKPPLCACGCGQPTSGKFNADTGEPIRYRPGHCRHHRQRVAYGVQQRDQIAREVAAKCGWTDSLPHWDSDARTFMNEEGARLPIRPEHPRVSGAVNTAFMVWEASETFRRVVMESAIRDAAAAGADEAARLAAIDEEDLM